MKYRRPLAPPPQTSRSRSSSRSGTYADAALAARNDSFRDSRVAPPASAEPPPAAKPKTKRKVRQKSASAPARTTAPLTAAPAQQYSPTDRALLVGFADDYDAGVPLPDDMTPGVASWVVAEGKRLRAETQTI